MIFSKQRSPFRPFKKGHASERRYKTGEVICREGDQTSELFIIKSGEVEVVKDSGREEVILSVLGRGQIFGEMAVFEKTRRSATIRATEPTVVQVMYPGAFLMAMRSDPVLVFQVLRLMSQRVRKLNEELLRLHRVLDEHDIEDETLERPPWW